MNVQNEYIINLANNGTRMDGRKLESFREISIEKTPFEKPEGSARIKMGQTDIIAGVKLSVGKPFPDTPDDGVLIVNAEFSPSAHNDFEFGPPKEGAIELSRVVDRGIRESKAIDTKKLCIEKGEKVWIINLDMQIINHSGNLIDACGLAGIAALLVAKMPDYDGEKINYEKKTKKLPVKFKPVPVTVSKIDGKLFVDCTLDEEKIVTSRLTITSKADGNICSLQKGGVEPFTQEEIMKAIEISVSKGKEIRKLLD